MKHQALFTLFLYAGGFTTLAQHALQSQLNMLRPGDELIKYQVSYKDPGRSGENVLWDFSRLKEENDSYQLKYTAQDSLIVGTEHRTRYYYALSNDSLLCRGYENQTTLMENKRPELLLRFPVRYQDRTKNYYYGQGKYCDRLDISVMGTVESHADAYGMILLPNGDTLRHVSRVKTVKQIAEETKPHSFSIDKEKQVETISSDSIDYRLEKDSVLLSVETYRWYAKGYRYPVFETVKSLVNKRGKESKYFDVAFFYPPQDHYYLEEDEANQAILAEMQQDVSPDDNPWHGLTYNFHPNPVVSELNVEMYLPRSASVRMQISERSGKVVMEERWGVMSEGVFSRRVMMGYVPRGEYVVSIWLEENYMVSGVVFKR